METSSFGTKIPENSKGSGKETLTSSMVCRIWSFRSSTLTFSDGATSYITIGSSERNR